MDAYAQTDRRRARLALLVLFVALCERASEPRDTAADQAPPSIVQAAVAP